jgi:molybdopterin-guanine dinucleotide biosynthesis protein A
MGRDKATIAGPDGDGLARRTARLLAAVADPVLEVGPGHAGVTAIADGWPGAGPLAAVASGVAALRTAGWEGDVIVVATDLPGLNVGLLTWLADHPGPGNVVPVVDGHPQLLCARYDAASIGRAPGLVGTGARRMRDLLDDRRTHWAGPEEWAGAGGSLCDVDTPEALAAFTAGGSWRDVDTLEAQAASTGGPQPTSRWT